MKRLFLSLSGFLLVSAFASAQTGNYDHLFHSKPVEITETESGLRNLAMSLNKSNISYDTPLQIEEYDVDIWQNEIFDGVRIFNYTAGGELRSMIEQDATLTNQHRVTFNWTSFGEFSSMIHEDWNGWNWEFDTRYIYTYNSAHMLESSTYEVYNAGNWELMYTNKFLYIGSDSHPSLLIGLSSDDNVNWQEEIKIYYTYAGNNPTSMEAVTFDDNYLNWSQEEKWEISNWGPGTFYPDFFFIQRMEGKKITDLIIDKINPMEIYPADFIYHSSYDNNTGVYNFKASITSDYDGANNRTAFYINEWNGSAYDSTGKYVASYDPCYGYKGSISKDYVSPNVWTINDGSGYTGFTTPYGSSCYVTAYNYFSNFSDILPNGERTYRYVITQATDLGLKEQNQEVFSLFPNPTEDILHVALNEWNDGAILDIITISGEVIHSLELRSDNEEINVSHMPEGIYLVRIVLHGETTVKRFVKN